jgi:hypothetical protein
MGISKIGGGGSDNWELISSVTPTASTTAVNFTGLSTYRKLLLLWSGISNYDTYVRLNNDSGSNYAYTSLQYRIAYSEFFVVTNSVFGTSIGLTGIAGYIEFGNCDMSGLKSITNGQGSYTTQYQGYYKGTSLISQVNFLSSTAFTATGTVYLYGVK